MKKQRSQIILNRVEQKSITSHEEFIRLEREEKILIGIDRIMARKFYTDSSIKKIEKETGETPYFEKTIVWLVLLASQISFLISIIFGFKFYGWWGIIYFIFCLFVYLSYSSISVVGNSKIGGITVLFFVSFILYFFKIFGVSHFIEIITIFLFSLWCIRFLYQSSTFFFREFIIRNKKAYQYFSPYLKIKIIK